MVPQIIIISDGGFRPLKKKVSQMTFFLTFLQYFFFFYLLGCCSFKIIFIESFLAAYNRNLNMRFMRTRSALLKEKRDMGFQPLL